MPRVSWTIAVVAIHGCAVDARAPRASAEATPVVSLRAADVGCYRLDATAPDSLPQLLTAHHRWVTLDTTRPAPEGAPFRPGLARMRDDEHRPLGAQEGYWWRDGRTDTLYVHSLMGFRLALYGRSESLAGYAYGVGDLDPRVQRYGTVTFTRAHRGAVLCAV